MDLCDTPSLFKEDDASYATEKFSTIHKNVPKFNYVDATQVVSINSASHVKRVHLRGA